MKTSVYCIINYVCSLLLMFYRSNFHYYRTHTYRINGKFVASINFFFISMIRVNQSEALIFRHMKCEKLLKSINCPQAEKLTYLNGETKHVRENFDTKPKTLHTCNEIL